MNPVLYVEDDPNDVFFLHDAWERAGISQPLIDIADGKKAMDYLAGDGAFADREKHPLPCLLVLDMNLPGKSGLEVLRWLRQQPALAALKVVILSASGQEQDIKRAQELGITEYIVKTADLNALRSTIQARKVLWALGT